MQVLKMHESLPKNRKKENWIEPRTYNQADALKKVSSKVQLGLSDFA